MVDRAGFISTDGVKELVRAIGKIDPELRRELGQRNKRIGERIIARAFPKPERVGAGAGSKPRASAATNVLRIMAGGSHRTEHVQSWGKRPTPRDGVKRPYIRRSAEEQMPEIKRDYLDALLKVARQVGIEAREG
jgi:hypothetical protein